MMVGKKSLIWVLLISLGLSACGGDKHDNKKSNTQVVAKVNGDEISVHQVNLLLARLGNIPQEQGKQASEEILRKLVEQQLLNQQAVSLKLERDPRILQIIEASKSEILAQAYLEKISAKAKKPTETEMSTFYKEHPELFEKRRIFRIQELVVDAPQEKFSEIEQGIKDIQDINQIAGWLKTNKFQFNANSNVKSAEQLPAVLLNKLQPLENGKFTTLKTDKAFAIFHLAASQSSPITFEKARPIIEQYYFNINKATVVKAETDALKKKANVEFLGSFSGMKMNVEEVANKDKVAQEPARQSNKEIKEDKNQSTIDKGLSGL